MTAVATPRPRRRFRRVGVVGVVLVLLFGGGGWYFSGVIESDALAVDPDDPEFIHMVTGIGPSTITFSVPSEPKDDLVVDQILGVRTNSGGYGQVGSVVSEAEGTITRSYTHLTGRPPVTGELVALEGYAYPDDPSVLGLSAERITYSAPAGPTAAWFVPGRSDTWVVFVHGRGATAREGFRMLPTLADRGYPVLLISYLNDADAPSSDGLARFGEVEWTDVAAAVGHARDQGASRIVLAGASMGGAMTASFLLESELADSVAGVILDAPALKLGAMVDARAAETNLPLLPVKVPMVLTATAKQIASMRYDLNWDGMDYVDRADEYEHPMLIFHGDDDGSVPLWTSQALADERPDLVTLEVFPGAEHVRAWNVDPERYAAAIDAFLDGIGV